MLVLTRKKNQSIMIGDKIEITIIEIKGDQIRIGISAPDDVTILRKEVYLSVKNENTVAIESNKLDLQDLSEIIINSTKKAK